MHLNDANFSITHSCFDFNLSDSLVRHLQISSQSRIYLSPNGFNSVSEHSGTFRVGRKSEYSKNRDNNTMMVGKTFEKIRLTLKSVGPAEA